MTGLKMLRTLSLGLLAAGFVLALGGMKKGCGQAPPDEPVCKVASDCEGLPSPDCIGDWSCSQGACVFICGPKPVEPVGCYSDADCKGGAVCSTSNGDCKAPPGCNKPGQACPAVCYGECVAPQGGCTSNDQCAKGEVCIMPPCPMIDCPPGATCPVPDCSGYCQAEQPKPTCQTDGDCAKGQTCVIDDWCPGCPPGAMCFWCPPPTGTCQNQASECWSDADCAADQYCQPGAADCPPCKGGTPCMPCAMPAGTCQPKNNGGDCTSDADCQPGFACKIEACTACACPAGVPCDCPVESCTGTCQPTQPIPCGPNESCPAGFQCQCQADPSCPMCDVCMLTCVPTEPPPPPEYECTADTDCAEGNFCAFELCSGCACDPNMPCDCLAQCWGFCQPIQPPKKQCLDDSWCDAGEYCAPAPCPAIACTPDFCPPCYGTCEPKTTTCTWDGDCAKGEYCQMDAACGGTCPPGANCIAIMCTGTCQPSPAQECSTDADCVNGQICAVTSCTGCACSSNDPACDCPPPQCWGTCQDAPPPPPPPCETDKDCAAGEACVLGPCPMAPCTPDWCPPCYGTCQPVAPSKCQVSGCSGEICAAEPMASICIYKPEWECLQYSACGNFAADGGCGWSQTDAYLKCMTQYK